MSLDLEFVRSQFPAFSESSLIGQRFFENAGGSYTCAQVIDRLTRFYRERKVQPYADYDASRLGGEEMDEARTRLAAWMGVDFDEVTFGPSTTQNTYVLSQAVREWLSEGDAIIVTNQDHEANSGAWRRLADAGITVKEWQIDPDTGHLNIQDLSDLLDESVRLVCFPDCSNVVAEINPVAEITALAHAAGAFVCVDGVSYAPHGIPDVGSLGADIYMFSSYKTYGPHQGIMVVRRSIGELLPNQAHYFNAGALYKRFSPAGPDHAQVAACAGMIDYFEALADHHDLQIEKTGSQAATTQAVHDLLRDHEIKLSEPLVAYLSSKNSISLLGPQTAETRAPTFAMRTERNPVEIAKTLAKHGIMTAASDFYAVRPLGAMNVPMDPGVLRLSFVHYTGQDDIDALISALEQEL
jgi:selenocysteine lyase/cysteine desulfurase